jgi:hypothetical protein
MIHLLSAPLLARSAGTALLLFGGMLSAGCSSSGVDLAAPPADQPIGPGLTDPGLKHPVPRPCITSNIAVRPRASAQAPLGLRDQPDGGAVSPMMASPCP